MPRPRYPLRPGVTMTSRASGDEPGLRRPPRTRKELRSIVGWIALVVAVFVGVVGLCVLMLRDSISAWQHSGFFYEVSPDSRRGPRTAGGQTIFGAVVIVVATGIAVGFVWALVADYLGVKMCRRERGEVSWFVRHRKGLKRVLGGVVVLVALGAAAAVVSIVVLSVTWLWTGAADWISHGVSYGTELQGDGGTPAGARVVLGALGTVIFGFVEYVYVVIGFSSLRTRLRRRRENAAQPRDEGIEKPTARRG